MRGALKPETFSFFWPNLCQYLSCYGQERDSSVVITKLAISFFVEVDDGRIVELLRYYLLIPHMTEKGCQLL